MKRLFLIFFTFILVATISIYFFRKQKIDSSNKLIYNTYTKNWEKVADTKNNVTREDITQEKNENDDGLHNNAILRGYFDSYDEKEEKLVIKSIVPFTMNNQFEKVELKLNNNQSVYCASKDYTDRNTGEIFQTKSLTFRVRDGEVLTIHGEKLTTLNKLLEQGNDLTYLFIQLTKDFDPKGSNYILKLIFLGLCE